MTNYIILAGQDAAYHKLDADGLDAADGDSIYVGQGALVYGFAQNTNTLDIGISIAGSATLTIDGTVAGSYRGISDAGTTNSGAQINIGRTGVVETLAPVDAGEAIYMQGGNMRVSNAGSISGELFMGGLHNIVVNSGYLDGINQIGVQFDGTVASLTNTGTILGGSTTQAIHYGAVDFGDSDGLNTSGHNVLENDGTISGVLGVTYFAGTIGCFVNITNHGSISATGGSAISARMGFDGGNEAIASIENLNLTNTGTISASDINAGAIDAQGAFIDTIDNSGTISSLNGPAIFETGAATLRIVNTGHIVGIVEFGDAGGTYDGTLGSIDGEVLGGRGNSTMLGGAEADTFELTAGDKNVLRGNGGDDIFAFEFGGGLTKNCVVDGGDGNDTISFFNVGPITAKLLTHVTSIETVSFSSQNSIVLTDAFVASAANHTVTVEGSGLADTINATPVTTATSHVIFDGGGGADIMYASAGADTFVYDAGTDSTGKTFDIIRNLNFAKDHIALPEAAHDITGINAAITSGQLDGATFNADLVVATGGGHLSAEHAVLFKPTTGSFSGDTFLIVDLNGSAGYQSSHDLVIQLIGATGTLAVGDFA